MADEPPSTWDSSRRMDASIDELISHPINLNNSFTFRTESGDIVPASLGGLSDLATYPKTYFRLENLLDMERSMFVYQSPYEPGDEHATKLDSVIATLSDEQFDVFARILACCPAPRHRMYLGICAMLPQDLELMQNAQTGGLWGTYNPASRELSPLLRQRIPDMPTAIFKDMHETHKGGWTSIYRSFDIDDVDGAADLVLKIALNMQEAGLDMNLSNIELLQRFASLSHTVSRQLQLKWMGKMPVQWRGIDEFTLDLRRAFGPDGCFLATQDLLAMINTFRKDTPAVFRILAPTEQMVVQAYDAFRLEDYVKKGI